MTVYDEILDRLDDIYDERASLVDSRYFFISVKVDDPGILKCIENVCREFQVTIDSGEEKISDNALVILDEIRRLCCELQMNKLA